MIKKILANNIMAKKNKKNHTPKNTAKNLKPKKSIGKKRPLNEYFKTMLDAKKHDKPFFMYKGKKYVQFKLKTGIKSYKKA